MTKSHGLKTLGVAIATTVFVIACGPGTGGTTRPSTAATVAPPATSRPSTAASQPAATATAKASQPAASQPAGSGGTGNYTIGFSNTGGTGNGFREEQNCTADVQAAVSGQVSSVNMIAHDTDVNGQLADLRTLIAGSPDAIVFNPSNATGLNAALTEAHAADIVTVAVDAYVTDPNTWNLYNNQKEYAKLGAKWLFDKIGGTGKVWYMRGIKGHPADTDRDAGLKEVLADYPNIELVPNEEGQFTEWNIGKTTTIANDFIGGGNYDDVAGIWTSGMDSEVVDAIKAAGKDYVPIVGTDRGSFVTQMLDETGFPGLEGAAVTNTAAVGGAGVTLALKLLNGETVTADPAAPQANTILLTPVLVDNTTDAGKADLDSWLVEGLNPTWPLSLELEGWTTYTAEQAIACKGPGE